MILTRGSSYQELPMHSNEEESVKNMREIRNSTASLAYWQSHFPRELIFCLTLSLFGWYSPKILFLPFMGGVTERPIPYQLLKSGELVLDSSLNNELVTDETIDSSLLLHSCVTLPLAILILFSFYGSSLAPKVHVIHASFCMGIVAIGSSEFLAQIFKFYVGRLRPNFYALCNFDKEKMQCQANGDRIMEGRMSFPSGHSSLSFCGMGILVWFFLGNVCRLGNTRKKIYSSLSMCPWIYSCIVATSRLVDNWHHPSDIIAGSILGIFCSTFSYHLWYPSIFSNHAGIPLSFLQNNSNTSRASD